MSGWQLNRRLKRSSYFNRVYKKNLFHGNESLSGEGSSLQATAVLRREIPLLLEQFLIRTVLDVPCGDLSWMKEILHIPDSYTGADIAKAAIKSNKRQFKNHNFIVMDVVKETPHTYDLIISRDLLVHLPLSECLQVLANFCRSNSRYLLTTSFLDRITNEDISYSTDIVQWRPLNLWRLLSKAALKAIDNFSIRVWLCMT